MCFNNYIFYSIRLYYIANHRIQLTFEESTQEIKYFFNKEVSLLKEDIILKDNENNDIPFDYYVSDKNVIIKPKNRLKIGDYKVIVLKVTAYDNYFGNQELKNLEFDFTVEEPLTFIELIFDKLENSIKYIFNKNISVNKEDISIINESAIEQEFSFTVNNNILNIFPLFNRQGTYTVQPKQVFSKDLSEIITDIPSYQFDIEGIKLIHKNFGSYVSSGLQNLIFTFNKEIESADVKLINNTDNVVIDSIVIINNDKLIIAIDIFV